MTYLLWVLQVLLTLIFLFAGGTKLVVPPEKLAKMGPPDAVVLPGMFIQFIGVCEVLGALGLLLPALLRIKPNLTPLAAACLTIMMAGGTVVTIAGPGVGTAIVPLVFTLLCAFVAYGRWKLAPISAR